MINPGEFRHKTTININTGTQQNDYGDIVVSATTASDRFARVKWLPGTEQENEGILNLIKNVEFTYRYETITDDIDLIDSITYDSENYYIRSVEFKGMGNQQLVIIKAHTAKN